MNEMQNIKKINFSSDDSCSSSDSDSDEVDNIQQRVKRDCGCSRQQSRVHVEWPPSVSSHYSNYQHLRHVHFGNPSFGNRMQLYSKTGQHLAIYPNGKVKGTQDENDVYTYLEVTSANFPGDVRIKGFISNLFVAMNKKGRLYGEANIHHEGTVFIESLRGSYNVYLSRKYAHLGWYIGLKKSGKLKKGPKTGYNQKAVSFLPRRSNFQ